MANNYSYAPDYAVPPGATLKETLEAKGLSQSDLAVRADMAEKTISQIINGIAPISYETAEKLELVLGIPARFWNAAEARYRETLMRQQEMNRLVKDAEWLSDIPVAELIEREYVKPEKDKRALVREVLRFFGVSSVEAWHNTWRVPAAQYRGKAVQEKHPGSVAAWLRMGELQAEMISVESFNAAQFKSVLLEARSLVLLPIKEALDKLRELCANAGVVIVLTKEIKGAGVSGAVRWIGKDKALIQLSLKYKALDQLWFTFFHEAAHILLHSKKQVFIEYGITDGDDDEREANAFARDILIPPSLQQRLPFLKTKAQITTFAQVAGTLPGIVVGRLQHDGHIYPSAFNDLKRKVVWEEGNG
jgi:HTH-type transcriptional regulator / antitoxin HigA